MTELSLRWSTNLRNKCLICKSEKLEKLFFGYSRFNPQLFHRLAICQKCGHIQQYPIFDEKTYKKINSRFFGNEYMATGRKSHIQNLSDSESYTFLTHNEKKLKRVDGRLTPFLKAGLNVLDVGAGHAWTLEYFQKHGCNYHAIEEVDQLADSIKERGGDIIGKSIFDDYSSDQSKFDVIFYREVLEHMLDPKKALMILRGLLNDDGFIYLEVPDAEKPSIHKGFRSSYIRPVHVSYFCKTNLFWLANSVGLDVIEEESSSKFHKSGMIFCKLKKGEKKISTPQNVYKFQKKIFLESARKALKIDFKNIVKDIPKVLIRKFIR